jgi:hypothetical protein
METASQKLDGRIMHGSTGPASCAGVSWSLGLGLAGLGNLARSV